MRGYESLEDALDAFELAAEMEDGDWLQQEEAYFDEETGWDDAVDLGEVLRGALHEDYADALPEELEAALDNMLDSMSPAESLSFTKALQQIEKGASRALADPLVGQIARTALPVAGGAAGTLLGPAGTLAGSALGRAAAKALPPSPKANAPATSASAPPPITALAATAPVSTGSAAAAQGLMVAQDPMVLNGLLALALGEHGRQSINGVPVGAVMSMLSSIFGRAAEDADELRYGGDESVGYLNSSEGYPNADPASPADRAQALYARLINSANHRLTEATFR